MREQDLVFIQANICQVFKKKTSPNETDPSQGNKSFTHCRCRRQFVTARTAIQKAIINQSSRVGYVCCICTTDGRTRDVKTGRRLPQSRTVLGFFYERSYLSFGYVELSSAKNGCFKHSSAVARLLGSNSSIGIRKLAMSNASFSGHWYFSTKTSKSPHGFRFDIWRSSPVERQHVMCTSIFSDLNAYRENMLNIT